MIELFAGLGIVAFVGLLFKINHDLIGKHDEEIEVNRRCIYGLDKKLDILITTLEIKYPSAVKKAKKKNGDETIG